jgi:hypothetical protein
VARDLGPGLTLQIVTGRGFTASHDVVYGGASSLHKELRDGGFVVHPPSGQPRDEHADVNAAGELGLNLISGGRFGARAPPAEAANLPPRTAVTPGPAATGSWGPVRVGQVAPLQEQVARAARDRGNQHGVGDRQVPRGQRGTGEDGFSTGRARSNRSLRDGVDAVAVPCRRSADQARDSFPDGSRSASRASQTRRPVRAKQSARGRGRHAGARPEQLAPSRTNYATLHAVDL